MSNPTGKARKSGKKSAKRMRRRAAAVLRRARVSAQLEVAAAETAAAQIREQAHAATDAECSERRAESERECAQVRADARNDAREEVARMLDHARALADTAADERLLLAEAEAAVVLSKAEAEAAMIGAKAAREAQQVGEAARGERERILAGAEAERVRLLEDAHAEAARIRAAAFEEVATFTRRLDTERTELMTEARAEAAKIVAAATPVAEPEPALVAAQPVVAKKSNGAAPAPAKAKRDEPAPTTLRWSPPDATTNGDQRRARVHERHGRVDHRRGRRRRRQARAQAPPLLQPLPLRPCSGERGRPDVVDHDVVRKRDVWLPEHGPVVLTTTTGNGHEPEPGLKSTCANRRVAGVGSELVEHGVEPTEQRAVSRIVARLELVQCLICDLVEVEVSHAGDGPSATDLLGLLRSAPRVPCSPGSAPPPRAPPLPA